MYCVLCILWCILWASGLEINVILSYLLILTRPSCVSLLLIKEGLYRIWCGANRLGGSGVHTLGDTSAIVNPQPVAQLLLTRRGKTRMDGVGIVFEFYIALL